MEKATKQGLYDVHPSPTVCRVIKSRRMRWMGHVAWMGRELLRTRFSWGSLRNESNLEDLNVGGRIIFKTDLKVLDW